MNFSLGKDRSETAIFRRKFDLKSLHLNFIKVFLRFKTIDRLYKIN
ncbi:hypothetical protein LSS_16816 [Leptospira santarosai serovar Shermani str. LT 821]|uniref:Uncharacterized protein n=1 Tax=Leptospira santarosai serovar Shermani str. LT 821 TaxID=758847 RepID=K8XXM5_9LEPT|nr:hypothetical protein LSS_16816 [Leptospira santarosai serovar Shermani str. LT 821]